MSAEVVTHRRRAIMASALGVMALLTPPLLGAWIVYLSYRGPLPRLLPREPGTAPPAGAGSLGCDRASFSLAGSGSNLVLTRRLAEGFSRQSPGPALEVLESIGSGGGVRATHDRVVDAGLLSRPFSAEEARWHLRFVPYARVAVVLAANPSVSDGEISTSDLLRLYAGQKGRWGDGKRALVLQREVGDSSHQVFAAALPGFAEANREAYLAGRWKVLYSDAAMQRALLGMEGAVGLFDQGAISSLGLPLKTLSIDGVAPNRESVASGQYPFVKPLAFALTEAACPRVLDFVAFTLSAPGQRLVAEAGYLPVAGGAP